jgi:hypothetical protein
VFGQQKPDFSGTWELTTVERGGKRIQAGTNFKETQIWVHHEPTLTIKMMVWDTQSGYLTVELTFKTNGETGVVGYLVRPDGTKTPVNGSARWDGQRLVYEQVHTNPAKHEPRRIICTCTLDPNGQKIVTDEVYWIAGSDQRLEARWTWERKTRAPNSF